MKSSEDASLETTTTTKPDQTGDSIFFLREDKSIETAVPTTPVYIRLQKNIETRDALKQQLKEVADLLELTQAEIDKCLDEIDEQKIRDPSVFVGGVSVRKRRTVNRNWFRSNARDVFDSVAKLDGKAALEIMNSALGGADKFQEYLKEQNPELFELKATFTMDDLRNKFGEDAIREFEARGGFHVESKRIGDAVLIPVSAECEF